MKTKDSGPSPFVVDIEELTLANENFRTAVWTGEYFQMADSPYELVMSHNRRVSDVAPPGPRNHRSGVSPLA